LVALSFTERQGVCSCANTAGTCHRAGAPPNPAAVDGRAGRGGRGRRPRLLHNQAQAGQAPLGVARPLERLPEQQRLQVVRPVLALHQVVQCEVALVLPHLRAGKTLQGCRAAGPASMRRPRRGPGGCRPARCGQREDKSGARQCANPHCGPHVPRHARPAAPRAVPSQQHRVAAPRARRAAHQPQRLRAARRSVAVLERGDKLRERAWRGAHQPLVHPHLRLAKLLGLPAASPALAATPW